MADAHREFTALQYLENCLNWLDNVGRLNGEMNLVDGMPNNIPGRRAMRLFVEEAKQQVLEEAK